MKKINKYRFNQAINLIKNRIDFGQPLKWIYIYGHHRGGTSYSLRQYMKIGKRGTGDWMMHQFAETYIAADTRERQKLNMKRLKKSFRKTVLVNAPIGGGQKYDFVLKQAVGTQDFKCVKAEIAFFTDIFNAPPSKILFLYREPHGWWNSAKKKFGHIDENMEEYYARPFKAFKENGGIPVNYGKELNDYFQNNSEFKHVELTPFDPKPKTVVKEAEVLDKYYESFVQFLSKS